MPLPPPDELRTQADALEAEALELEARAAEKRARAFVLRRVAEKRERLELHAETPASTVHSKVLSTAHKASLGKAHRGHSKKFAEWISSTEHGAWSMNGLAAAVGISPTSLSQAQRKQTKDPLSRPIRKSVAERIMALTGWPADDRHWPGGIRE